MINATPQPWQNYKVVSIDQCPIANSNSISNSGNESTSNLPFPGGWYSDTDKKNNPYGGSYTYRAYRDKTLNKPAYTLDVVPNFQNNVWIVGNSDTCLAVPESCSPNAINYELPYNLYPKTWTGYRTENPKFPTNDGINVTNIPKCGGYCDGKGYLLCSTDTQMSLDSCPGSTGIYALKNQIYVAETADYHNVPVDRYPRGMGTCIYPADIIQDNDDLVNLMALRDNKMIHPELADILGLNYCYSPIQLGPGQGCGVDFEYQLIQDCNIYYYDKYTGDTNSPCVKLVDKLIESDIGQMLLNEQNQQWCNNIDHIYNPLCDCIKADVNTDPNGPRLARTVYQELSDILIPRIPESVPKKCWFTPCDSYAMPIYDKAPCPKTDINCNNIIDANGRSFVDNNRQYINCVDGPIPGGGEAPSQHINIFTSIILPIFIILFVIGIVNLLINRAKQKPSNKTS